MNTTLEIRNENYYSFEHFETEEERVMNLFSNGKNYTALEVSRILNIDKVNCRRAISNLLRPKYVNDRQVREPLLMALPKEQARIDSITNKKNTVFIKILKLF